jgi:hypothetical protein
VEDTTPAIDPSAQAVEEKLERDRLRDALAEVSRKHPVTEEE